MYVYRILCIEQNVSVLPCLLKNSKLFLLKYTEKWSLIALNNKIVFTYENQRPCNDGYYSRGWF